MEIFSFNGCFIQARTIGELLVSGWGNSGFQMGGLVNGWDAGSHKRWDR